MLELIEGDLEPDMDLAVTVNGIAQDITSATTITLHWLKPNGTVADVTLTAVDLTTGQVKRIWAAGDTSVVGYHRGRVVITWSTGEKQTFPNDGSWHLWVVYSKDT
jgi:NADPH-dependent ferric siderophore reductase